MSLYKRGTKYYYRFQVEGKKYAGSCKTDDKALAQAYEEALTRSIYEQMFLSKGKGASSKDMSLKDAYRRLYNEKWKHNATSSMQVAQANRITEILGNPFLSEICGDDISALREELNDISSTTVNRYLANLKTLLNTAANEWQAISSIPFIRLTKEKHRISVLSTSEQDLIWNYFKSKCQEMHHLCEFLLESGARLSEALNVNLNDYFPGDDSVIFRKTKSGHSRIVPLSSSLQNMMKERFLTNSRLFSISLNATQKKWKKMKESTGVQEVTLHTLRHTCATRLVGQGIDSSIIQKLLGHESILTTMRYINLSAADVKKAMKSLKENNNSVAGVAVSVSKDVTKADIINNNLIDINRNKLVNTRL